MKWVITFEATAQKGRVCSATLMPFVLCFLSLWWTSQVNRTWGEQNLLHFTLLGNNLPWRQIRVGIWNQEWRQRRRRNAAYRLVPRLVFSCLSYTAQAHMPRNGTVHTMTWAFLHLLTIRKLSHRHVLLPIWSKKLFIWVFLFPDMSNWCLRSVIACFGIEYLLNYVKIYCICLCYICLTM